MFGIDEKIKSLEAELALLKAEKEKEEKQKYSHYVGKCFCSWTIYFKVLGATMSDDDKPLAKVIQLSTGSAGISISENTVPFERVNACKEIPSEKFDETLEIIYSSIKNQTDVFEGLKKEAEKKPIDIDGGFEAD